MIPSCCNCQHCSRVERFFDLTFDMETEVYYCEKYAEWHNDSVSSVCKFYRGREKKEGITPLRARSLGNYRLKNDRRRIKILGRQKTAIF